MIRTIAKFIFGLILLLLLIYIILALFSKPADDHPFFENDSVLVMAHQGGKGLWPDNTMYAFEHAAELGVDVLEMDIHSTADGVLVVMHDDTVDGTTNGTGRINDFSIDELKGLDAGYHWTKDEATYPYRDQGITVPALEEVFEAFPDVRLNVEIKQTAPSITNDLCQMIKEYGRETEVLVASFDAATIKEFREICPDVSTSLSQSEVVTFYVLSRLFLSEAYTPPGQAVQVPEYRSGLHVLSGRLINAAASRNLDVHAWTINDEEDMQRLIELGVDGIITDYPDKLMEILGR
jgi:glycerophosphoryl diester phosphodiesterase